MIKKLKLLLIFIVILSLGFLYLEVTYFSINRLKVRNIEIIDAKIPYDFEGAKILVFSDSYGNESQLKKVQELVLNENPDFIIFLGNLLDEETVETEIIENTLKSMEAPLGKYAILGNDGTHYDLEKLKTIYNNAGFRFIDNQILPMHRYTDSYINFALFDNKSASFDEMFSFLSTDTFTLIFNHSPEIINSLEDAYSVFSGETLKGQVNLPLLGSLFYKDNITTDIITQNGAKLYLSGGIGTPKPRIRFKANPDILLITLKSS